MSVKFGVDGLGCFVGVDTHTDTQSHMPLISLPTHQLSTLWVMTINI